MPTHPELTKILRDHLAQFGTAPDCRGHSVDVLLRIYAKCVVGQDELAKRWISEACARANLGTYWAQ